MAGNLRGKIAVGGIAVLLTMVASCAPKPVPLPPPPPPPPPVVVIPPRPLPPRGAAPSMTIPPIGLNGVRQTINTGASVAQTTWNFRAAYNVAALNCLRPEHGEIVIGYRAYLKKHARALTAANRGVDTDFKAKWGTSFIRPREAYMTQVYNFYAYPATLGAFCDTALTVSREVQLIPAGQLDAFSAQALPRLDAVFEAFFRAYEQYRLDAALWDAKYAPAPAPAGFASPVPTVTPAPTIVLPPVSGTPTPAPTYGPTAAPGS